jgi:hypothetical protein
MVQVRRHITSCAAILIGSGALFVACASSTQARPVTVTVLAEAALVEIGGSRDNRGVARILRFPNHGEVQLDVHGFRRPAGEFAVWLKHNQGTGKGFFAGSFPPRSLGEFDVSTVVPGSTRTSIRVVERGRVLILSRIGREDERVVRRRGDRTAWRRPQPVVGQALARGRIRGLEEPGAPERHMRLAQVMHPADTSGGGQRARWR